MVVRVRGLPRRHIRAEQWEIGKLQLPAAELEVLDEANRSPADYRGSPPFKH